VFEHLSTGASDDLAKVTNIARSMAMQYGMMPELGHVSYEAPSNAFGSPMIEPRSPYSDATAHEIDAAVKHIVDVAFGNAREVLARNRDVLEAGAEQLLERETMDEKQLLALFAALRRGPEATPVVAVS
jgi:cell division protease FtsH